MTQTIQVVEYPLKTQKGMCWFEGRMNKFGMKINNKNCVVMAARDITLRKKRDDADCKINQELKARITELSTLNRITRTAGMTHDLKNVLEFVSGEIGMLMDVRSASIALFNEKKQEFKIIAHYSSFRKKQYRQSL